MPVLLDPSVILHPEGFRAPPGRAPQAVVAGTFYRFLEEARAWDSWLGSYYPATIKFFIGQDQEPGLSPSRAFSIVESKTIPYWPSIEALRDTAESLAIEIDPQRIGGEQRILLEQFCYLLNESWGVTRTAASLSWAKRSGAVGLRGDSQLLRNTPQADEARRWLPGISGFILVGGSDFLQTIGVEDPLMRLPLLAFAYFVLRGRQEDS